MRAHNKFLSQGSRKLLYTLKLCISNQCFFAYFDVYYTTCNVYPGLDVKPNSQAKVSPRACGRNII